MMSLVYPEYNTLLGDTSIMGATGVACTLGDPIFVMRSSKSLVWHSVQYPGHLGISPCMLQGVLDIYWNI